MRGPTKMTCVGASAAVLGVLVVGSCAPWWTRPSNPPGRSGPTHPSRGALVSPPDLPDWESCFPVHVLEPIDPGGQGGDLLNVGFAPPGMPDDKDPLRFFLRVAHFDVGSARNEADLPIEDIQIKNHVMTGTIHHDGGLDERVEGRAWVKAEFSGTFACPASPKKSYSVRARIRDAKWSVGNGSPPAITLPGWTYFLELLIEGVSAQPLPACYRDPTDTVVPIPANWDETETYVPDTRTFSFGCVRADVAKCIREGYAPDDPADKSGERRDLFRACTRMMRADYCGTGLSYTRKDSYVSMWDKRGIQSPSGYNEPYTAFEAAWNPDGAVCYSHFRWADGGVPIFAKHTRTLLESKPQEPQECLRGRRCSSEAEAERFDAGQSLLFNKSCLRHPCASEKDAGR